MARKPRLDPGKRLHPTLILTPAGATLIDGLLEFAGVWERAVRQAGHRNGLLDRTAKWHGKELCLRVRTQRLAYLHGRIAVDDIRDGKKTAVASADTDKVRSARRNLELSGQPLRLRFSRGETLQLRLPRAGGLN